jgi:hypothetical protein
MPLENPKPERLIGDYRLKELLADDGHTATWLAEQVSIGRLVVLDELRNLGGENRARFLADSRARAAVDHPFIASVYEASDAEGHCFRASERLSDATLQSVLAAGGKLEPARLSLVLRCLAEANLHHETNARMTLPLTPTHIHVDGNQVTRIENLAIAGHRDPDASERDIASLGRELMPLVALGRPGSTRVLTLLSWMRGKNRPAALGWHEIINLCDQIDQQLTAPVAPVVSLKSGAGKNPLVFAGVAIAGVIALVLIVALAMKKPKPPPVENVRLPPILIPAGEHPSFDGKRASHRAFIIDARETTIAEYREFLETLKSLASTGRSRIYDHPEQPTEKKSHEPADWEALLFAARARGTWNGVPVSLHSPVPGVDFWDATAYANWRKARLPTPEEWAAAVHHQCENPAAIPAGRWHPGVPDKTCPDYTPAGLLGVSGSLREWTRGLSINPANPLGRPQPVIVGGSFRDAKAHAMSREWIADGQVRRADLGFRLVRDASAAP